MDPLMDEFNAAQAAEWVSLLAGGHATRSAQQLFRLGALWGLRFGLASGRKDLMKLAAEFGVKLDEPKRP